MSRLAVRPRAMVPEGSESEKEDEDQRPYQHRDR